MSNVHQINGFRSSDSTSQPLRLDKATNTIQIIDYAHHEIHAGSSFHCHFGQVTPTGIGEMTIIAFWTPAGTKWLHILVDAYATGAAKFAIYEDADLDVDEGTDLTVFNRDRNSIVASTVLTIETVPEAGKATSYTVAQAAGATLSVATPIAVEYIGASAGKGAPGESRGAHEWILCANKQYAFVIANLTADDTTHQINLSWYEHTNLA